MAEYGRNAPSDLREAGGDTVSVVRILPHPRVQVTQWDIDGYPASIKVRMGDKDGTMMEFVRPVEQPKPHVIIAERLTDMIRNCTYGYSGNHQKK